MKNQISKNQTVKKTEVEIEMEQRLADLEKKNPALFNAIVAKAKAEVRPAGKGRVYETKKVFNGMEINRHGDIHFKRVHTLSAKEFSGIEAGVKGLTSDLNVPGTPLTMTFSKGKIVIAVAKEE